MNSEELYKTIIENLSIENIHPLHKAILEECCENALNDSQNVTEINTIILAVQVAFITCVSTLKGTLEASLKMNNADQITLNYRGQTFFIPKDSPLLRR